MYRLSMLLSMVLLVVLVCLLLRNVHDSCNAPFGVWGRGFAKGEGVDGVAITVYCISYYCLYENF